MLTEGTLSFKNSFHFSRGGVEGVGGGQGEYNDKLEDKPPQLAVLWRPLVKLKTLLTSL